MSAEATAPHPLIVIVYAWTRVALSFCLRDSLLPQESTRSLQEADVALKQEMMRTELLPEQGMQDTEMASGPSFAISGPSSASPGASCTPLGTVQDDDAERGDRSSSTHANPAPKAWFAWPWTQAPQRQASQRRYPQVGAPKPFRILDSAVGSPDVRKPASSLPVFQRCLT